MGSSVLATRHLTALCALFLRFGWYKAIGMLLRASARILKFLLILVNHGW
jgi:hypothetical protein